MYSTLHQSIATLSTPALHHNIPILVELWREEVIKAKVISKSISPQPHQPAPLSHIQQPFRPTSRPPSRTPAWCPGGGRTKPGGKPAEGRTGAEAWEGEWKGDEQEGVEKTWGWGRGEGKQLRVVAGGGESLLFPLPVLTDIKPFFLYYYSFTPEHFPFLSLFHFPVFP